jgi:hypothetical protein
LCCLICLLTLQSYFFLNLGSSLTQPIRAIPANLRALLRPGEYQRQMLELQNTQLAGLELPRTRKLVGGSTVDVFGQDQSYAIFNNLNYRPRPIFQSYMAYNTTLSQMNERFYFSQASPEYVLFRLTPVDRRFAPLEDGAVLRDLLVNYESIEAENQFLLLKAKPHRSAPNLSLLRDGTVRPGEPITLDEFGQADLWMEVIVKPTLLGRVRQFFYKPTIVRVSMWRTTTRQGASSFRAPAPMLAAGFVASPLLTSTEDALNLYADCAATRPCGCSIELGTGKERFWQDAIHYRIYRIENKLGRSARENLPRLLTYAGFKTEPTEIISHSNAFVRVENQPAFFLPVGGSMQLSAPKGASTLAGKYGLGTSAPNAQAANFLIEEELPDGTSHVLQSYVPKPGEFGMKSFSVSLSADTEHKLVLRSAPATNVDLNVAKSGEKENSGPLSCWADVRFN